VNIAGIRRADLLAPLEQLSPARLSASPIARHRCDQAGAGTYRYYLTRIGRRATGALCHLTQSVLIPARI
jgi:hypothetical protein